MRTEVGHFLDIVTLFQILKDIPFSFFIPLSGIFFGIGLIVNIYQLINIDTIYII